MLISFDGLDSSGKATQVSRLHDRLIASGTKVLKLDTPDYTTETGKELKLRLQGKLGDWVNTPWEEKADYFARNRAEHKQEVLDTLADGGVVLYDRYVPSSLVFMQVEAGDAASRDEVISFVEKKEYEEYGMPHGDMSIFLDVPPRVAAKLLVGRKGEQQEEDEYTDQIEVQEKMYEHYQELMKATPNHFIHIKCMDGDALHTPDTVSEMVWQEVSARISM